MQEHDDDLCGETILNSIRPRDDQVSPSQHPDTPMSWAPHPLAPFEEETKNPQVDKVSSTRNDSDKVKIAHNKEVRDLQAAMFADAATQHQAPETSA